ncbi:MAG TPA: hypothetical protein VGO47_05280 [Chlamydiales bacterium]|nr:hypothetical protein [Chlamydiales bacterium]
MFSKLAVVASILAVATATQTITAHPPPPTETTVPNCTTGLSSQFLRLVPRAHTPQVLLNVAIALQPPTASPLLASS